MRTTHRWIAALAVGLSALSTQAAGTLSPAGSSDAPLRIEQHHVEVTLNNGFARTEVQQTFRNPGAADLEAVYSFPLPKSASLSELTIFAGEREIHGEVLARKDAEEAYRQEKDKGSDAGLAVKNGYQDLRFSVSRVPANGSVRIRFVYYQPLEIDTGTGRYLYPLEEGGTDEAGASFWTRNDAVDGTFSAAIELKSAWPVADVRVPGFESDIKQEKLGEGHYRISLDRKGGRLDRDLLFYYRLQDGLPGRVELIPYRADKDKPGTFMLVVTPGIDLAPVARGADYAFVLDVSGSMQQKIRTLGRGVAKALGGLRPEDRFRIVTFSDRACDVTGGYKAATPENVQAALARLEQLGANGSTNLHDGLSTALRGLDDDRVTSVVLVTDGVTNTGVVSPAAFDQLLRQQDVRVFGFLMGSSANWPLMRTICEASGGFYAGVSNDDDIVGQILLAKSKIAHECLHDATLKVEGLRGVEADVHPLGKVYRGQQLAVFGRYDRPGKGKITLTARLSGEDKAYTAAFELPAVDKENPEIERLWALDQIERIEAQELLGKIDAQEARASVQRLGVQHQLVTDHTAMVVLSDDAFAARGIERANRARVETERQAQAARAATAPQSRRMDGGNPAFPANAPSLGGGAGVVDPLTGLAGIAIAILASLSRKRDAA